MARIAWHRCDGMSFEAPGSLLPTWNSDISVQFLASGPPSDLSPLQDNAAEAPKKARKRAVRLREAIMAGSMGFGWRNAHRKFSQCGHRGIGSTHHCRPPLLPSCREPVTCVGRPPLWPPGRPVLRAVQRDLAAPQAKTGTTNRWLPATLFGDFHSRRSWDGASLLAHRIWLTRSGKHL